MGLKKDLYRSYRDYMGLSPLLENEQESSC